MSLLKLSSLGFVSVGITLVGGLFNSIQAIPVTNATISFANAGGVFDSRQASFRVPEKTTINQVKYGLRLYDVHIAKMIEVSNYFCNLQKADPKYIVYWNYEVEDGNLFMGKYSFTCQFAKDTLKKFGTAGQENVNLDFAGNAETAKIAPFNFNDKNAKDFAKLVQTIKPECIEVTPKICPGDRLE